MFYLGIDVAKKSSRYLVLDAEGKRVVSFTLENLKERFQNLLLRLQEAKIDAKDILAGLEATGWFWENLYQFLQEKGFKVILLNPYYVNKFREALAKKAKTDDIDALVIASLLRTGEYMNSIVPEEKIQVLREYTNLRYEFLKTLQDYKRKAISLLGVVFPEYERTALRNPFGVASIQLLKEFPTAKDLALVKPTRIEKIVRSIQGNNFDIKEIQSLLDWAKNSIYSGRARESRSVSLKMLLEHVSNLNSNIQELDKKIEDVLSPDSNGSFPGENLLSIPGVGKKTVAAVLSYLGIDGSSFCSAKKVTGFVGFFPKLYQSGETRRENRISHRGPKVLRWALYMSAVACLIHNKEMRMIYNRKISQGKTAKQALIVVAKKLLQIMLAMLKSGKTYNPIQVFANV
jgi:transposase